MWVAFYNYYGNELVKSGMVWLNLDNIAAVQVLERPDEEDNYSVYLTSGNKYRLDETDYLDLSNKLAQVFA